MILRSKALLAFAATKATPLPDQRTELAKRMEAGVEKNLDVQVSSLVKVVVRS